MEEYMQFACKYYAMFHKGPKKPGVVTNSYYSNTWETEATRAHGLGHLDH